MKVQPPAESFHQELSRPSLGLCVFCVWGEFVPVWRFERVSLTMSVAYVFTPDGQGNPHLFLTFHCLTFSHQRRSGFSQCHLAADGAMLTHHDDPADKRKHDVGERHSASGLASVFSWPKWWRQIPLGLFPYPFNVKKQQTWAQGGFCIGLIKGVWFGIHRLSQTLREWP